MYHYWQGHLRMTCYYYYLLAFHYYFELIVIHYKFVGARLVCHKLYLFQLEIKSKYYMPGPFFTTTRPTELKDREAGLEAEENFHP